MDWNRSTMYEQRVRFILEVQQRTFSFAESCRRYGISRTAGYTWWNRFRGPPAFSALQGRTGYGGGPQQKLGCGRLPSRCHVHC